MLRVKISLLEGQKMVQATYLEETLRKRDDAQRQVEALEKEIRQSREKFDVLRQLVTAYEIILETATAAEQIRHPSELVMPLDVAEATSDGQASEVVADDITERQAPKRNPEFEHMALPNALDTLVERDAFHKILTVDDFVDAIYVDLDAQQRIVAKRTFNGELSRAVQRGTLFRVGRGRYIPIDNQPIVMGGETIE